VPGRRRLALLQATVGERASFTTTPRFWRLSKSERCVLAVESQRRSLSPRGSHRPSPTWRRRFARHCERAGGRSQRCRVGRFGEGRRRSPRGRPISRGNRPFHKRGTGCVACPRCWRSRRTAVNSSCPIQQPPTSRCVCSSTPTTDARAAPAALPSPARAVVLPRANAALSELVLAGAAGRVASIAIAMFGSNQTVRQRSGRWGSRAPRSLRSCISRGPVESDRTGIH
jgi:hypothetical protein